MDTREYVLTKLYLYDTSHIHIIEKMNVKKVRQYCESLMEMYIIQF